MGRLKRPFFEESVAVRYHGPAEAPSEVLKLQEPWIADEGPLAADFWRHPGGDFPRPLHMRGLAFDDRTTVQWDEDAVWVIEPKAAEPGVIARRSEVLLRDRFPALASLQRIDYLRSGVLIASRYLAGRPKGESEDA